MRASAEKLCGTEGEEGEAGPDAPPTGDGPEHEASIYPEPDDKMFYGIAGEIACRGTLQNEASPVAVLAQTLGWAAASIGRGPWLPVGESSHHARLFFVVVGATAKARKGTSAGVVDRVFEKAADLFQGKGPANKTDASTTDPVIARQTHGPLSSGEGLIFAVRDKTTKRDKDGVEVEDDAGQPDKRLYVVEEEMAAPLASMKREGATLSAIVRCAWDGHTLAPMTKSNRLIATKPHVCITGHITFKELRELVSSTSIHNGFVNRFIWVVARRSKVMSRPQRMPDSDLQELAEGLGQAVIKARKIECVAMSEAAAARWDEVYSSLGEDGDDVLDAITSRAEANVLRLALTYCLLDGENVISLAHLEAALALWAYAKASAAVIFSNGQQSDPTAAKILDALKKHGPFTQTDISVKVFNRHVTANQLRAALEQLQAHSLVVGKKQLSRNGGRTSTVWSLVPCEKGELREKAMGTGDPEFAAGANYCELGMAKSGVAPLNSHKFAAGAKKQHSDVAANSQNSRNSRPPFENEATADMGEDF